VHEERVEKLLMGKFILKTTGAVCLLIILFCLPLLLPATPYTAKSYLFAEKQKDALLLNEEPPRMIFVGGSNVMVGLNSRMVKDSLNINPINTSIGIELGLKYMLDNTSQFIREGDIVVVIPEYQHFFRDYDYGSEDLLRMVWDVDKSKIRLLSKNQIKNCFPFIFYLSLSKLNILEYLNVKKMNIYNVHSINEYGDNVAHWNMERRPFYPARMIDTALYNPKVMEGLKNFEEKVRQRGAVLFVSYPSFQDLSFDNSPDAISMIEEEYKKNGFTILGDPYRYRFDDSLMFDSPSHLNKEGTDIRTQLLIEDLKTIMTEKVL
jgi:hypothetical protein